VLFAVEELLIFIRDNMRCAMHTNTRVIVIDRCYKVLNALSSL